MWKDRKVLSLITFDFKGTFNGIAIDVLLDCLKKRQIPKQMVIWIKRFCENRKATIIMNRETSAVSSLSQARLPQTS